MSFNSVVLLSFKFPGPCFLRSTGHIIFFSWTIMSKDKSCNEVNPMWSTNLWDKHVPYSFRKESAFFNVPCKPYSTEGAGDSSEPWIYSLCSRRLQCLIIFQLIILSYFKSLRIGPYCERLITIYIMLPHVVSLNFHIGKNENVSCLNVRKFNFTFSIVTSVYSPVRFLWLSLPILILREGFSFEPVALILAKPCMMSVWVSHKSRITVVEFTAIQSPLWCCLHANVYTVLH